MSWSRAASSSEIESIAIIERFKLTVVNFTVAIRLRTRSAQAGAGGMSGGGIPRKFSKVLDEAREETEMQQLYDELDSVRAQLVRGRVSVYTRNCPGQERRRWACLAHTSTAAAASEALLVSASMAGE